MDNLDLKKELKQLYAPSTKEVAVVDMPAMHYLMVDGAGNPNTAPTYRQTVEALFPLAYSVRAICKAAGQSFTVMPLEGLWWFKGQPITDFVMTEADKDRFLWTMMILMPDFVDADLVAQARQSVAAKQDAPVLLDDVRFAAFDEGQAVQIMHIGPYADEGPNIKKLHDHIASQGWALSGKHHEIYLSDPRKAAPEKLRTVIRQPFRP
jgi:hypothetical protein